MFLSKLLESHFETFSLPEVGSGIYVAPEVLPKGVVRSLYLLQPGLARCKHSHDGPKESVLLGVGCVGQIGNCCGPQGI